MSTAPPISADRVQKFIDDLKAQKTIVTKCTELFTTLTNHFTSLQNSLSQKSQSLDTKFLSLSSTFSKSLESLSQRQSSLPERESAAAARIEALKVAAFAEFDDPKTSSPQPLSETLKSLSRRMDSAGLVKFIISKRKESVPLRAEISVALSEAVDPHRLVLEAFEDFVSQKIGKTLGLTDKRWACGMLVHALFPESSWKDKEGKGLPEFSRSIGGRAREVVEKWKRQLDVDGEGLTPGEAVMFLHMVVGFELKEGFDGTFLRKLVLEFSSRRDMAKLAAALGFGDAMGDIIDELVKNGKEIEAVYFARAAGLTERFPPVPLLKSYLQNSKNNATTVLKNRNFSATEESKNVELNSIKAIIKCVEDHKLESEFSVDSLRKRVTQLEKVRSDRKKSSSSTGKPQNKRSHSASSSRGSRPPAFRPAKAAKFSNAYPPFNRRNPTPSAQQSPAARYSAPYNYGTVAQNVFEAPTASYASAYGVTHSQSPAAVTQQHYSHPVENLGASSYLTSGAYGGQTSYGAYDYGSAAPSAYQPSSSTQ